VRHEPSARYAGRSPLLEFKEIIVTCLTTTAICFPSANKTDQTPVETPRQRMATTETNNRQYN
jgi:hypothetical protein